MNDKSLEGRVAPITGGGRGLGLYALRMRMLIRSVLRLCYFIQYEIGDLELPHESGAAEAS
jgi:hypothetical protein